MDTTLITCLTQFITTLMTILASILIAYLTYCSQKAKSNADIKRLQVINCNVALELFRAFIATLTFFNYPNPKVTLNVNDLRKNCRKMEIIEQHLSSLTETDLPDTFINDFQYYRLKIAFCRLTLENILSNATADTITSQEFHILNLDQITSEINQFIIRHDSQKTEG